MSATISTEPKRLTLHDGQQHVYTAPTRFRVVVAGRRWGKTQLARTELLARALRRPGRYWYIAPTYKSAKDILWRDLKDTCDPSWLVTSPNETELKLDLCTGAEIRLMGAEDPDALRGRGLQFAVLDEFADMKPATWTEAIRPSLSDYQAPALFIGTPKSFNHFYDLYARGTSDDPGWQGFHFRTIDNPFLRAEEINDARRDMDERTFRQEYEASFEALAGRAYYAFDRHENVGRVALDPSVPVCLFFDFNIDPASAGIGQQQGDRVVVWREVQLTHRGGEATRSAATEIGRLLRESHGGDIGIYGDATGKAAKTTGPADHQVLRDVFPQAVWRIPRANPHQRDRVSAVNALCQNAAGARRLTVDPSCRRLIADLEQVIFADNGELDKKSNPALTHISDALGYWLARDFPIVHTVRAGASRVEWLL